jgi:hypothetical protein
VAKRVGRISEEGGEDRIGSMNYESRVLLARRALIADIAASIKSKCVSILFFLIHYMLRCYHK